MNEKNDNLLWTPIAVSAIVWLALYLVATDGVRGSDQYWYVSEVRSVLSGSSSTNSLWPAYVVADSNYLTERPFVHRGISPYVIAWLGGSFGEYGAWRACNLAASLSTATLIAATLRQIGVRKAIATVGGLFYLTLPVVFWNATQPLVETMLAFFIASMIFVATRAGLSFYVRLLLLMMLAAFSHHIVSIFQPVALAIGLGMAWAVRSETGTRELLKILAVGVTLAASLAAMAAAGESHGLSLLQILMNGARGGGNMEALTTIDPVEFSWVLASRKMLRSIAIFVERNLNQVFLAPFLFILAAASTGLAKSRNGPSARYPHRLLTYMLGVACGVYSTVILLHQNQARYTLYVLPVAVTCVFWAFRDVLAIWSRKRRWLLPATLGGMLSIDAILSVRLRHESRASRLLTVEIQQRFFDDQTLRASSTVLECYHGGTSLAMTYALPDVRFVHVSADAPNTTLELLVHNTGAAVAVCPHDMVEIGSNTGLASWPAVSEFQLDGKRYKVLQRRRP
jgi:hypothetical protein